MNVLFLKLDTQNTIYEPLKTLYLLVCLTIIIVSYAQKQTQTHTGKPSPAAAYN